MLSPVFFSVFVIADFIYENNYIRSWATILIAQVLLFLRYWQNINSASLSRLFPQYRIIPSLNEHKCSYILFINPLRTTKMTCNLFTAHISAMVFSCVFARKSRVTCLCVKREELARSWSGIAEGFSAGRRSAHCVTNFNIGSH